MAEEGEESGGRGFGLSKIKSSKQIMATSAKRAEMRRDSTLVKKMTTATLAKRSSSPVYDRVRHGVPIVTRKCTGYKLS
ncbi:hypothetical protein CDL15_Pgr023605 [Punica granatum]|uniref:Uncharacterized protein n=1 Tax=Punica granatum TaxID=22663 RepID=A0A218W8J4_PUNGR|nr:hypothetical protein CDL15_Pgr023605 [Punica granatum]PKI76704.1 hypothetical protein CRG98_003013 [Punica granatum]